MLTYLLFRKSVSTKGALVSNGDCKETSSFETGYSNGKLYQEGTTTDNNVVSTGIKVSICDIEMMS